MSIHTENITFQGPSGDIECAFDWPEDEPAGWALVLHPHPLHGGTRDNKVVTTIARACVEHGLLAIRPNFRGVGASQGEFDKGIGETADMQALLQQFRQRYPDLAAKSWVMAGFSFGTAVAARLYWALSASDEQDENAPLPPDSLILVGTAAQRFTRDEAVLPPQTLLIHGETDDVVALSEAMEFARGHELPMVVVPDATHFFHGKLLILRALVEQRLAGIHFL